SERAEAFLLGILSSVPLDWYARRVVELHVDFHIFNSFPVPQVAMSAPLAERVITIAAQLTAQDTRLSEWADRVGVNVFPLNGDELIGLEAELDAAVAHLYGLDEEDVVHIFETFHEGWDDADRLKRVLEHFRRLA